MTAIRESTTIVGSMYQIGLTGNIGTGKSTVLKMLTKLGAKVIDADQIAHQVMQPGGPAYQPVVEAFGPDVLRSDGTIDRARLGEIAFNDPAALKQLENLTHPPVGQIIAQQLAATDASVVVIEAIKLIEAGMASSGDALWIVTATRERQIERLMATRQLNREEAEARVDAQPSIEPKLPLADVVIENNGTIDGLWKQVRSAWERIPEEERRAKQ
ncbi:MAG: dephospho-CoA kinase [Anaerolineae bacterium]